MRLAQLQQQQGGQLDPAKSFKPRHKKSKSFDYLPAFEDDFADIPSLDPKGGRLPDQYEVKHEFKFIDDDYVSATRFAQNVKSRANGIDNHFSGAFPPIIPEIGGGGLGIKNPRLPPPNDLDGQSANPFFMNVAPPGLTPPRLQKGQFSAPAPQDLDAALRDSDNAAYDFMDPVTFFAMAHPQTTKSPFQSGSKTPNSVDPAQFTPDGKGGDFEKRKPIILEETKERYMGRLKFFDENKNYGFIIMDDDGSDIFVHYDDLSKASITKDFLRSAKQGALIRMSFSCMSYIGKYNKSRKAIDIQLLYD
jgi:hypothetical protein